MLLVVVAACLVYSNSFDAGFVYDNRPIILDDPRIQTVSGESLSAILKGGYWHWLYGRLYRPVTTLSYMFNYSVLGNSTRPAGYHALNLILHSLNACLLFLISRRLRAGALPACGAALLFAVHPVTTEAVTNIVGRADLLAAFFTLTALYIFATSRRKDGSLPARRGIAIGACSTLAALSKESGVVVFPLLILFDILFPPRASAGFKPRALSHAWTAVGLTLWAIWRLILFSGEWIKPIEFLDNPLVGADFPARELTAFHVFLKYAVLTVLPLNLSADYSYNQIPIHGSGDPLWAAGYLGLALCVALIASAVYAARKRPVVCFGILFFLGALAPVSNLLIRIGTIMADRLLYLPLVGAALAFGTVLDSAVKRGGKARVGVTLALAAATGLLGARTYARNRVWNNNVSLFSSAVKSNPDSYRPYRGLAGALFEEARGKGNLNPETLAGIIDIQKAAWSVIAGLPPERSNFNVPTELAEYYRLSGSAMMRDKTGSDQAATRMLEESTRFYRIAIKIYEAKLDRDRRLRESAGHPRTVKGGLGHFQPYAGLARALLLTGRAAEARRPLAEALRLRPTEPSLYHTLAEIELAAGQKEHAVVAYIQGYLVQPRYSHPWQRIEALYGSAGRKDSFLVQDQAGRLKLNTDSEQVRRDIENAAGKLATSMINAGWEKAAARIAKISGSLW